MCLGCGIGSMQCSVSLENRITKGMAAMLVYLLKENDGSSFVKEHEHGGYDVTCISFYPLYS